jgi:integrase
MSEQSYSFRTEMQSATLDANSGDPFAVQRLLGHADLKMGTTYVQDVSEQTDRVINGFRKFIIRDDS